MEWFEAIFLGIVQGLTEYLPVSSSGHLVLCSSLLGIDGESNLPFAIAVHVATVLSTVVVLWKEIVWLVKGLCRFKWNEETRYAVCILVSMIPVGIVGVGFKDALDALFGSGLLIVGCMLVVTSILLFFSYYAKPRQKTKMNVRDAFVIGLAQAVAVLPGLSRSGATISTGLLLGHMKSSVAQFSFLMVIPPILGEALLDGVKAMGNQAGMMSSIGMPALAAGFVTAFVVGCLACRWMVNVVKKGKLNYFALYCVAVGILCVCLSL